MTLAVGTIIEVTLPGAEVRSPARLPLRLPGPGVWCGALGIHSWEGRACKPAVLLPACRHQQALPRLPPLPGPGRSPPLLAQNAALWPSVLQAPIHATVLSCSATMQSVRLQEQGSEVRWQPAEAGPKAVRPLGWAGGSLVRP